MLKKLWIQLFRAVFTFFYYIKFHEFITTNSRWFSKQHYFISNIKNTRSRTRGSGEEPRRRRAGDPQKTQGRQLTAVDRGVGVRVHGVFNAGGLLESKAQDGRINVTCYGLCLYYCFINGNLFFIERILHKYVNLVALCIEL